MTTGYDSHAWLYLSGHPVVCDRYIEVGAIISSINPSLSMTSACLEVAELQQQLLWLLYDMNHLQRYPMAIGCLGKSINNILKYSLFNIFLKIIQYNELI